MEARLDPSSKGAFNDMFVFSLDATTDVTITMSCVPCQPHLTLVHDGGAKIEGDTGWFRAAKIARKLAAGKYQIWAGALTAGEVGEYSVELAVKGR